MVRTALPGVPRLIQVLGTVITVNPNSDGTFLAPIRARLRQRDAGLRMTADASMLVQGLLDIGAIIAHSKRADLNCVSCRPSPGGRGRIQEADYGAREEDNAQAEHQIRSNMCNFHLCRKFRAQSKLY